MDGNGVPNHLVVRVRHRREGVHRVHEREGNGRKEWWGNAYGRKGHLDAPAFATYHRSFQMVWDGNGEMPRVVKRTGV